MATNRPTLDVSKLGLYHVVQPIVDILTERIIGYEMLLRCEKYKNPKELFHYAKTCNKCVELDLTSIRKAFSFINAHAYLLRDKYIFINVLPTTVTSPLYFKTLHNLIDKLKVKRDQIVFEITEDAKESSVQSICTNITRLKKNGFRVAIDDFGKGDSTIQYVQRLRPHIVKLDRYYSQDLAQSYERKTLIDNMLFLLQGKTKFIVEGIETDEDLQAAKNLGVRYCQGFYLGKPNRFEHYMSRS